MRRDHSLGGKPSSVGDEDLHLENDTERDNRTDTLMDRMKVTTEGDCHRRRGYHPVKANTEEEGGAGPSVPRSGSYTSP